MALSMKDVYDQFGKWIGRNYETEKERADRLKKQEPKIPEGMQEPVVSFLNYFIKHPNYFRIKQDRESEYYSPAGTRTRHYILRDSYNNIQYEMQMYHFREDDMYIKINGKESITFSGVEKAYLYAVVKKWTEDRSKRIFNYRQAKRNKKEQKVRDQLTIMYREE